MSIWDDLLRSAQEQAPDVPSDLETWPKPLLMRESDADKICPWLRPKSFVTRVGFVWVWVVAGKTYASRVLFGASTIQPRYALAELLRLGFDDLMESVRRGQ